MAVMTGQQPTPTGVYTAAQATAGRAAYDASCSACHRPDLGGANEAPQLAGGNFLRAWGPRTSADLLTHIQRTMPPENPGGLSGETYLNIVAYILQANGVPSGAQPLTVARTIPIDSVAMTQASAVQAAQQGAAPGGRGAAAPPQGRAGGGGGAHETVGVVEGVIAWLLGANEVDLELDGDDADMWRELFYRHSDSGNQPAAANGDENGIEVLIVL
jgi:cytochrome c5